MLDVSVAVFPTCALLHRHNSGPWQRSDDIGVVRDHISPWQFRRHCKLIVADRREVAA